MGRAVFPPCCLTWGQTMVEVMEIMAISFKRCLACIATVSDPNPTPGHTWWTVSRSWWMTHASTGNSWTLIGKAASVSCRVTAPFSSQFFTNLLKASILQTSEWDLVPVFKPSGVSKSTLHQSLCIKHCERKKFLRIMIVDLNCLFLLYLNMYKHITMYKIHRLILHNNIL